MAVIENDYAAYIQTEAGEYPLRDLGALRTYQCEENAGKILTVGSDGIVTPVDMDETLTDNTKAAPAGVVGELKSDLSELRKEIGMVTKNAFDYSTCQLNKIQSTASLDLFDNDFWCTTDFIELGNATSVTLGRGTGRYVFVDETKTTILGSGTQNNNAEHGLVEFSVPNNAKYLRVSVYMEFSTDTVIYLCGIDEIRAKSRIDELEDKTNLVSEVIIIAKDGNGDYTTLREGISEAIKNNHRNVYVNDGVYDLLEEFSDVFSQTLTTQQGIKLENDVHVIFSSNAKVTCLYDGQSVDKVEFFSPFYGGENGGFTLENLNIESTNTRYCVHDDQPRATKVRNNNYINCIMKMDNTTGVRNWYPQCIGGGCSNSLKVLIRGCYFKSKFAENNIAPLVSYHNTKELENPKANIFVENNYFADNGTFRATYYGDTGKVSIAIVNGNSCGAMPYVEYEVPGAATPQNFELISWNNEIRTN